MVNLDKNNLPQHIAIIMDGNRRWAREKGLPEFAGHQRVVGEVIEELIETCGELGIPYITLWAWSSENWTRPKNEVTGIMKLFRWALTHKAKKMIQKGAKLNVIGYWRCLDEDLVKGIEQMLESSKHNTKITVTFAINYGGREEILRAMKKVMEEILRQAQDDNPGNKNFPELSNSKFEIENLNQETINNFLDSSGMPDPDMIIRPGFEKRLSGFMLWQSQYSELFFPEVLMPDFRKEELLTCIKEYQCRQRRFGS